jgi:4-amino-4-deoxy-L-arabinose transferase-like glycosyltransferase
VVDFYVRYGVVSTLVVIAVALLLVYGPRVWWQDRWWLLAGLAVLLLGLLPHLVWAWSVTGSPFGVLSAAGRVAGQVPTGTGLAWYAVHALTGDLAGWPASLVMLAGLLTAGAVLTRRRVRPVDGAPDDRWLLVLVICGLLQVVVIGIPSHPEPRYVFFAVFVLVAAGAHGLVAVAGRRRRTMIGMILLALVAVVGATVQQYRVITGYRPSRAVVAEAGSRVSGQRPCLVVGQLQPELGWYSGCRDVAFSEVSTPVPWGTSVHLVWFDGGPRPTASQLAALARRGPVVTLQLPGRGRLGNAHLASVAGSR